MSEQPYGENGPSPTSPPQRDDAEQEEKLHFSADDGLEQEIQRAIAQHDLAQQLHEHRDTSEETQQHDNVDQTQENDTHAQQGPAEPLSPAKEGDNGMDIDDEKLHLLMIADELKRATSQPPEPEKLLLVPQEPSNGIPDQQSEHQPQPQDAANHPGYIPPDSELLATNTALAAYNALLSQVPPVALLTNVHLAAVPLPIVAPDYFPARIQLLINTLPVLDNLSTQLLRVFATGPYQKIIDLASTPDTPAGAAFRDLTSLFEFTKRLYSEEDPFLNVEHLAPGMWKEGEKTPSMFRSREQTIESTLRKVNLATFLAATLGTIEVGFFYLNESFLDVFCPANNLDPANSMSNMNATNMNLQSGANTVVGDKVGKLLKPQALIFIDLKTQAYISAVEAGERSREEILEDILPSNLEQLLLERRGVKTLTPTETDFVSRCHSRKETLLNYPEGLNLGEEYEWFEFLKDLFDYVSKNMGFLIWGKKTKMAVKAERPGTAGATPTSHTPHSDETLRDQVSTPEPSGVNAASSQEINDITSALLPSEIQEQQIHIRINPRMQGKVTNRRPWTREEEKALRHALELKGTQWSTILELFGQGGRINESLKNRTQVQLKDKARNWKMFFLKSGLPVPAYLQKVTGDLERDDKVRAKNARNRKTAAAPVPAVNKKDDTTQDVDRKRRRVS